jgi:hypothetical protein
MPDANPYLAAAYLVFLAIVLLYVSIMATRLSRLERELAELTRVGEDGKVHAEDLPPQGRPEEVHS